MAEGVLFNVAGEIINNLAGPLAEEIKLLGGVNTEVEKLKLTVSAIRKVLLHAGELQATDSHVKEWLGRLGDVMFEAEDLLDAVSTEAERRKITKENKAVKKVRKFFSKSNPLVHRRKVGNRIKEIRDTLDAIESDMKIFPFVERLEETPIRNMGRDETLEVGEEVIGRELDKEAVIGLMDTKVGVNVSIIPIVGIGGLGKTALAQLIFGDQKIKEKKFWKKMWVCVSDDFKVETMIKKILEEAGKKPESSNFNTLGRELKEVIWEKKYFLVLDDVWDDHDDHDFHEKWSKLINLLKVGGSGSIILVTTRILKVAETLLLIGRKNLLPIECKTIHKIEPYVLKGLGEKESWALFETNAFRDMQEPDPSMVEIGRGILKKCAGVPLVLKTVGSLLYDNYSRREWLEIRDKKLVEIDEMKEGNILKTLKFSYYRLPSHLKHCFVYCSLFPKDSWLNKSMLTHLWIAQGFVLPCGSQCLEDIGNKYFRDLYRRSFFQEAKVDEFGDVIGCKMHDLMHDVAISEAGSLISTLDLVKPKIDMKTRHIAFYENIESPSTVRSILQEAGKARTFLSPGDLWYESEIVCEAIFSSFKCLRALDLSERGIECVPSSIDELIHLRYLNLSGCGAKTLPDSVTRLQNLQTLILLNCQSLQELPRGIKKLMKLRHLEISGCPELKYMPRGLGKLTNLQTLSQFIVGSGLQSGRLDELGQLENLRGELEIVGLGLEKGDASEYEKANLKLKQGIDRLILAWTGGDVKNSGGKLLEVLEPPPHLKHLWIRRYPGSMLPSWLSARTGLVCLELDGCQKWNYLPELSQLSSLKNLRLHGMNALQYISNYGDWNKFPYSSAQIVFFPSLEKLDLNECPNLEGWWRVAPSVEHHCPSFLRLSELSVVDCPMLNSMPTFPHLEKLCLTNTSLKPVQQTIEMNMSSTSEIETPSSSTFAASSSTCFSKLKYLELHAVSGLETLPAEWRQKFSHIIW